MASMRDIRRRRDSIRGTEQITKAMKLVATVKLQKARAVMEKNRPYTHMMGEMVASLAEHFPSGSLPWMREGGDRRGGKKAVVVITSNRGLAGGYNSHMTGLIISETSLTAENTVIFAIGRKGRDALAGKGYKIAEADDRLAEEPEYRVVEKIGEKLLKGLEAGQYDEVYLAYTQFKNTVNHVPVLEQILPLENKQDTVRKEAVPDYEPGEEEFFQALLPQYVSSRIYGAILEAAASENGARMNAMESAAGNAEDLIEELELQYNRARQGSITQELTEIIAGAGAV